MKHQVFLHLQLMNRLTPFLSRPILDILSLNSEADADKLGVDSTNIQFQLFASFLNLVIVSLF